MDYAAKIRGIDPVFAPSLPAGRQGLAPTYVGVSPASQIKENLNNCLTKTNFTGGEKIVGKVRDKYILADKIVMISTDRQSAFDRVLAAIPFKGQVLNQISAWWFKKTAHIIPNHLLEIPDPNSMIVKKCAVLPIEMVVRGYLTGSTDTSAWTNYQKGIRDFCGNLLPEGMVKNQKFSTPIITPTTKSDIHDRNISPQEIVQQGLLTQAEWDYISQKALELFRFGQATAQQHGLILVDTKYEFGKDQNGNILLIDEIHTPDSSRFWLATTYQERFNNGQEPENIDKEFLRLWFKEHCDPYHDSVLPEAPAELVTELSRRYIQLYEMITGENFAFPPTNALIKNRLAQNLSSYLQTDANTNMIPIETELPKTMTAVNQTPKVILIMGSTKDEGHVKKITDKLKELNIAHEQYIASAHKQAAELLRILEKYKNEKIIYITIAGRSNALSGFVAGNTDKIVIACPSFADKLDMIMNINSTLQMPSQVPVMTVLDPKNAALAAARIILLTK